MSDISTADADVLAKADEAITLARAAVAAKDAELAEMRAQLEAAKKPPAAVEPPAPQAPQVSVADVEALKEWRASLTAQARDAANLALYRAANPKEQALDEDILRVLPADVDARTAEGRVAWAAWRAARPHLFHPQGQSQESIIEATRVAFAGKKDSMHKMDELLASVFGPPKGKKA